MPRYVAFLRAINVGGHVLKMERLRGAFEPLGFANVKTFIASGNVIFEARSSTPAAIEKKIEALLRSELGYEVATFIRTEAELKKIAEQKPFSTAELRDPAHSIHIAFLQTKLSSAVQAKLANFRDANVDCRVDGREIYWLFRVRFSDSGFSGARLEKAVGMPTTIRNANTIARIAATFQ